MHFILCFTAAAFYWPPAEQSGNQALIPIGIGVALGAVVVLIVVIAVVVGGVMVVQRRRRKVAYAVKQSQGNGITNAIYAGSCINYSPIEQPLTL